MSGLVALLNRERGDFDDGRLDRMLSTIDHRGPDGRGAWVDDAVGLGHQHLRTTPQAVADDQPETENGTVVTADCRLDNRAELFGRLPIDRDDGPVPDSHLLLAAYDEWGTDCVEHLVGAFAFAIWDGDAERLFCARDHFGVKPLYYHRTDDLFGVASEIKALVSLPSVSTTVDETRVGDYLTGMLEDKTNTFYRDVRRLAPAHAMTISIDAVSTWQYWDLDPTRTIEMESEEAYAERFRDLLEQAVESRLRTTDRIGTTLSGGLDSSSITVLARELLPDDEPLATFSGVFEDVPACDEREYIETITRRDGIASTYVTVDELGLLDDIEEMLAYHDEPLTNTMHFMKWEIAKRARADGVGVMLEGAHGDNAVDYGLGLLPELVRTGRWYHLVRELRAMGDVLDRPAHRLFTLFVLPTLIPRLIRRQYWTLRGVPVGPKRSNPLLDDTFVERLDLQGRKDRLDPEGAIRKRSARRWQYRSLMTGSMTEFLEANDVLHAAFGIEPRYPFIDVRLIEYSLAIPGTMKLKDGWTRYVIREALADSLPDEIRWRPWKTTLNQGFADRLGEEMDRLDALAANPGDLDRYLDIEALREARAEFADDPMSGGASALWKALSLSYWLDATETTPSSEPRVPQR
ncbi:asparagine synthase (glutamine-hydrolyzing) [Halorientalis pallida]|uniref:asparagine synthase (glutamine-hydrolyzing) n=1 Tax=Halorientalis pallida TaxID=2479928 RepID=UPI003C6F5AC2